MNLRTFFLMLVHILVVALNAFVLSLTGLYSTWYLIVIVAPIALYLFPAFSRFSYTINFRIILPFSVGLLFVGLYQYFPEFMASGNAVPTLTANGLQLKAPEPNTKIFEVNPTFVDAVTVLYAVCAAFLLWKGLNDFDELKSVLYEEASEMKSLSNYFTYLSEGDKQDENTEIANDLRALFIEYIDNLTKGEEIIVSHDNEEILRECLNLIGKFKDTDVNDRIAIAEVMKGLNHLTLLRSKRSVCIEKRMSPFILVLIAVMSLAMSATFFGDASQEFGVNHILIFLLPAFYTSLFMTLLDLSSPFDGYWKVKCDSMNGVKERLREEIVLYSRDITHPSSAPK